MKYSWKNETSKKEASGSREISKDMMTKGDETEDSDGINDGLCTSWFILIL